MDLEESRKKEKQAAKDEVKETAGGLSFSRVADLNRSFTLSIPLPQVVLLASIHPLRGRSTGAPPLPPVPELRDLKHVQCTFSDAHCVSGSHSSQGCLWRVDTPVSLTCLCGGLQHGCGPERAAAPQTAGPPSASRLLQRCVWWGPGFASQRAHGRKDFDCPSLNRMAAFSDAQSAQAYLPVGTKGQRKFQTCSVTAALGLSPTSQSPVS